MSPARSNASSSRRTRPRPRSGGTCRAPRTAPLSGRDKLLGRMPDQGKATMLGRFTTRRVAAPPITAPEPESAPSTMPLEPAEPVVETPAAQANALLSEKLLDAKVRLHRRLIEEINLPALEKMPQEEVRRQVHALVSQYIVAERLALNARELEDFVTEILDEMMGLGTIEPLLKDPTVND